MIFDQIYLRQLEKILGEGTYVPNDGRTGEAVIELFGLTTEYPISEKNFPLLNTKKIYFKTVVEELLWFLRGSTSLDNLPTKIWEPWRTPTKGSDLGPIYGKQWRNFGGVDQIQNLLNSLSANPRSRRHIVSAWNPPDVELLTKEFAAPPPCHCFFQVYDHPERGLSLQLYQRSVDWMVGKPYNLASYALLLVMLAKHLGKKTDKFIHVAGNAHVYEKHLDGAKEQLSRTPKADLAEVIFDRKDNFFEYEYADFTLKNYDPHPHIKLYVAK